MIILNKILIFLVFKSTFCQTGFFQDDLAFLTDGLTNTLVVTEGTSQVTFYQVSSSYDQTGTVWTYYGSNYSITNSLGLQVALFDGETPSFTLTITSNSDQIFTFQIDISATGSTVLTLSTCSSTLTLTASTQSLNCANSQSENVILTGDSTVITIADQTDYTITSNTETTDPLYIVDINLSLQYIVGSTYNTSDYSTINLWKLQLVSTQSTYMSFQDFSFSNITCPNGCTQCNSSGTCTACYTNFTLSSGSCTCANTEMTNFTLDSTTSLYFPYEVCKDTTSTSVSSEASDFLDCQDSLENMLSQNYVSINTGATFNTSQITFTYDYAVDTSISLLDSFCTSNLDVYPTLEIPNPNDTQSVFYQLNDSPTFSLTKSFTLNFSSWDSCEQITYSSQSFYAVICPIRSYWILTSTNFSDVISYVDSEYIQLYNSTTNNSINRIVIPVYSQNQYIKLTQSSEITANFCLNSSCYTSITSYDFIQTNMLYVIFIVTDPQYLYSEPSLTYAFYVNGEVRTSLIQTFTQIDEDIPKYRMSILLNSADISGETSFQIILTYTANTTTQSQTLSFSMNIVDPYSSNGTKNFRDRLSFIFIIFTFGGLLVLIIFGLFCSLIAQYKRKKGDVIDDDFGTNLERSFEMKTLKSSQTHASQNQKVTKLLESLM